MGRRIRRSRNCTAGGVHLVHLPGSVQTQIVVGNRAITRKHPDWLRLDPGELDLRRAFQFRLVMNIREQKGYTYSPRSGVHPLRQPRIFHHLGRCAERRGGRHADRDIL